MALESDGEIQVFDIWGSKEHFEVFGQTLVPILASLSIEMGRAAVARGLCRSCAVKRHQQVDRVGCRWQRPAVQPQLQSPPGGRPR
jgi:hypothetical protein